MKKFTLNILVYLGIFAFTVPALQSCNDEPDGDAFYSFTGQMMSDYLLENSNFSMYAKIVQKAGLMDQLSAYGHYTCFAPVDSALENFLEKRGKTIDDLTVEECDTIARTHLVNVMYSVSEMGGETSTSVLPSQNMMRRNLQVDRVFVDKRNYQEIDPATSDLSDDLIASVVKLNGGSIVIFEHQDDSVENGIMQPINCVLENSTQSTASLIKKNPRLSLYTQALEVTTLFEPLDANIEDKTYNEEDHAEKVLYMTGGSIYEVANPPAEKKYGYTAFMCPDDILEEKYGVVDLKGLYDLACQIYDPIYPDDVNKEEHKFENASSPINPLYRFMAYHLLDRNVQGYNFLTVREDLGVRTDLVNPTDWYTTMLPYTMIKVEHLTMASAAWLGDATVGDRYVNRRYDDLGEGHDIRGAKVSVVETEYTSDAINGVFFYVDDVLKFDEVTRDEVQNCRIRMDFSTIFPEIMTQNHRMNGTYTKDDEVAYDDSYKYGKNYYYPDGYLKNVKFISNQGEGHFIYRRPRMGYYSMHGDEMIANGVFDLTFEIPPVPFTSTWQIRLGFSPMDATQGASRGVFQIYFDGVSQGIPLNMDEQMNSVNIHPSWTNSYSTSIRDNEEARAEDFKILKNKGYYRGPYSVWRSGDAIMSNGILFCDHFSTARKVLCTVNIEAGKSHTLRIKNVSSIFPKKKEAMLDYLELVPRSVYGISGDGEGEDDL